MAIRRKILVSIPTEQHAERMKLEGVLQYAHEKKGDRWDLTIDVGVSEYKEFDGIIVYVKSAEDRTRALSARKPVVLIEDLYEPKTYSRRVDVVTLLCDHVAEGRTAARYFLDRHYVNYAFIGTSCAWSARRREGFRQVLRKAGCSMRQIELADLKDLPKPCAVFAAHDLLARRVVSAAERLGKLIPDDIAVLGVDDDEVLCTTSSPAISSIPTFDRSLGMAAGRALNEIFLKHARGRLIRTRHTQVITRHSTEKDAIEDPFVARCLDLIRSHLTEKLTAESLARRIGYSKQCLQDRVARAVGMPLGFVIRRIRLQTAEELLTNTRKSISEISEICGYASVSHLSLRLREAHGMTPLEFREKSLSETEKDSP